MYATWLLPASVGGGQPLEGLTASLLHLPPYAQQDNLHMHRIRHLHAGAGSSKMHVQGQPSAATGKRTELKCAHRAAVAKTGNKEWWDGAGTVQHSVQACHLQGLSRAPRVACALLSFRGKTDIINNKLSRRSCHYKPLYAKHHTRGAAQSRYCMYHVYVTPPAEDTHHSDRWSSYTYTFDVWWVG